MMPEKALVAALEPIIDSVIETERKQAALETSLIDAETRIAETATARSAEIAKATATSVSNAAVDAAVETLKLAIADGDRRVLAEIEHLASTASTAARKSGLFVEAQAIIAAETVRTYLRDAL